MVADGVGGSIAGSTASSMAVEIVRESYYEADADPLASLKGALERAHRAILARSTAEAAYRGMATTCTAAVVIGNDCYIAHVGDSRAYLVRGGGLAQLTEDHTLVGKLVKEGLISPEEAKTHPQRNVIMRAMGSGEWSDPFTTQVTVQEGDCIFLCSDGLHGLVPDDESIALLVSLSPSDAVRELIEAAKRHGGTDNISVALLCLSSMEEELEPTRQISVRPFKSSRFHFGKGFYIILASAGLLCVAAGALLYFLSTMPSAKPPW